MPQSTGQILGLAPTKPNFVAQTAPQQVPQATPQPSAQLVQSSTGLDPKIVNLAQAFRQTESGGNFQAQGKSGEYGAYQFMPDTWAGTAPKYGVNVPLEQATPQQQNEVAYKQLADWAQEHPEWNVGNFASAWNAGPGKPNAYLENNVGTNSKGVSYDTPAYAQKVATAYQQFKAQNAQNAPLGGTNTQPDPTQQAPSLGGFGANVLKSAGAFGGDLLNSAIHPLQTVQGLGSIAAGGLQKLGGEDNQNTQNFDNVINSYKQKYGSVQNIEKTLYENPVGVAADLSAILGLGGGALGLASKGAELAGASDLADIGGSVASGLTKASDLTNPLTPIVSGTSALMGGSKGVISEVGSRIAGVSSNDITDIFNNPEKYTPEEIANTTRLSVGKEIEDALNARDAAHTETGGGYNDILKPIENPSGFENVKNTPADNSIPVRQNFLEDQLRTNAKVDVEDGIIKATGASAVRAPKDVKALQNLLDTWKPEFQKGYLTPQEFINFRGDLADAAKYDREFSSSKPVENIAAGIRKTLNEDYRGAVPGLQELDAKYAAEADENALLRKGFVDKEGNLLSSALNKIANSLNKGKNLDIQRLEQILPGITQKLQTLKTIENIQKVTEGMAKDGLGPLKIAAVGYGALTGNMSVVATALASTFIASPELAIPVVRALGNNKALISTIVSKMARYATLGAASIGALGTNSPNGGTEASLPQPQATTPSDQSSEVENSQLQKLKDSYPKFDFNGAIKAGYTDAEIKEFLAKQNQ